MSGMNPNGVTIQMWTTGQCFPSVLFIMKCKVILPVTILGIDISFTWGTLSRRKAKKGPFRLKLQY